jgi:predicted O-methyltransferase YrrM
MTKYEYSQTWFFNSEIKNLIDKYFDKKKNNNILEIGCFEGLSSCFFSDNFLDNPDSTLDCVDPYVISGTVKEITTSCVTNSTIKLFKKNIKKSLNYDKIYFHQLTSDDFFQNNIKNFDFIYIDGNHTPEQIKRDIENSLKFIRNNGIIWMDDYGGGGEKKIKPYFDKVLEVQNNKYNFEIIHKNYQLAVKVKK